MNKIDYVFAGYILLLTILLFIMAKHSRLRDGLLHAKIDALDSIGTAKEAEEEFLRKEKPSKSLAREAKSVVKESSQVISEAIQALKRKKPYSPKNDPKRQLDGTVPFSYYD